MKLIKSSVLFLMLGTAFLAAGCFSERVVERTTDPRANIIIQEDEPEEVLLHERVIIQE